MTRFEWDQLEKQRGTFFKFYRWACGDRSLGVLHMLSINESVRGQSRPECWFCFCFCSEVLCFNPSCAMIH